MSLPRVLICIARRKIHSPPVYVEAALRTTSVRNSLPRNSLPLPKAAKVIAASSLTVTGAVCRPLYVGSFANVELPPVVAPARVEVVHHFGSLSVLRCSVQALVSCPAPPGLSLHSERNCPGLGGGGYPVGKAGAPGIGAEA